jgi:hypothetical protein
MLRTSNLPELLLRHFCSKYGERAHPSVVPLSSRIIGKAEIIYGTSYLINDKYSALENQQYRGWDIAFRNVVWNCPIILNYGFRIPT